MCHQSWRCGDARDAFITSANANGALTQSWPSQGMFQELHAVTTALHSHDVAPALDWAARHQDRLRHGGRVSVLEFALCKLRFVDVLQKARQWWMWMIDMSRLAATCVTSECPFICATRTDEVPPLRTLVRISRSWTQQWCARLVHSRIRKAPAI